MDFKDDFNDLSLDNGERSIDEFDIMFVISILLSLLIFAYIQLSS
ncbi:hypothetical protein [Geoglobus acetivorans]